MNSQLPIQRLEEKLQLLVKKYRQLQEENIILHQHILAGENELAQQRGIIGGLENKIALLQIAATASGTGGDGNKKELRLKINEYIKEIDKCIALLNN